MTEQIYQMVLAVALLINGASDLKSRLTYNVVFLITSAVGIALAPYRWICIVSALIILFIKEKEDAKIGMGDITALLLIVSVLGLQTLPVILIACVFCILHYLITKNRNTPFVAGLAAGYLIELILTYLP